MNAKELERFLGSCGASPTQVDVVIRRLRTAFNGKAFQVSTGGRGTSAANLKMSEVSWILCAFAGSDVASKAAETFAQLLKLENHRWPNFVMALQLLMMDESVLAKLADVEEVRICRNFAMAKIVYRDASEDIFTLPKHLRQVEGLGKATFRSEGVLTGSLLRTIQLKVGSEISTGEQVSI